MKNETTIRLGTLVCQNSVAGVGVNLEVLVELTVGMRVSQSLVGRPALGMRVAGGRAGL